MKQLKIGTKIEMEHKPTFKFIKQYVKKHKKMPTDKLIATKIASNHLKENKNYYKKIIKYKL